MTTEAPLIFKYASEAWEVEQIHRLNYRTFVEEIPQHSPGVERRLVDRFHAQNTYLICVRAAELLGMLAVRAERPFSLDAKVPDLDSYLPENPSVCEVRLLAVRQDHRRGRVLRGLLELLARHGLARGYTLGVVSATTRQQRLYRRLGFVPFAGPVGTLEATYQPMYVTMEAFRSALDRSADVPSASPDARSGT